MNCPICDRKIHAPNYCDHWADNHRSIKVCYDYRADGSCSTEVFSTDIQHVRPLLKMSGLISWERIEKLLLLT